MISQFLEPHQRFQLSLVNKWFQQVTKDNKLNYTMVFWVFSDSSGVEIYSEKQDETLNDFLEDYKALLPWINSNNVELKFLTVENFLKLFHNSSNFSINMLILNNWVGTITEPECLKVILNSLKFTILSLENYDDSIPDDFLETCSESPTLKYLKVRCSTFPSNLNLEKTYFKNIIFNHICFNVRTNVGMPLCLEKFHLILDLLQEDDDQDDVIEFQMNQCQYIKEL
jgi:hypothetical protein